MIDAVFALVLILSVVFGAKRGLFRSFMALAAIVLALIGASLLTDALTEPVTDMLVPRLEKSVEEWFDTESQTPQGDVPQIEGETPAESDASGETPNGDAAQDAENVWQDDSPLAVTGLLKKLLRFDFDGAVRQSLRNAARDAALAAVRTLLGSVVRTLVFVLCFLVLTLLLRLVTGGIDKVLDLPVLNALNRRRRAGPDRGRTFAVSRLRCRTEARRQGLCRLRGHVSVIVFYESYSARACRRAVTLIFTPRRKCYAAATLFQM